MNRGELNEKAKAIKDKLLDIMFAIDTLSDEITTLKETTEETKKDAKRHKGWYEELLSKIENTENKCMTAYKTLDQAQTNMAMEN